MTSLRYAAKSDVGPVRKNNQDSGYAGPRLLVVADGIGGQAAGDLASSLVVQTVRRLDTALPDDLLEALAGAVHRANDRLAEVIEEDPSVEGMGTTLTALVVDGDRVGLAHVGDSRGYLLRDAQLTRITTDHTFVQQLIDEGRITEAEARTHPHRSLIMRALDGRHSVDADLELLELVPGDRVLLCSDGLSSFVDEETIATTLGDGTVELATTELVRLALAARTTDNVTCVVGEVVESPADDAAPGEPVVVGAAAVEPSVPRSGPRTAEHPAIGDDAMLLDEGIDPEALRYAPRSYRRYRWTRRVLIALAVLLVVGLGLGWLYSWSQSQYYVAASDGNVAIFRGIDQDVPGLTLSHLEDRTSLPVSDLPDFQAEQVADGIPADNVDDAEATVASLRELARDCAAGGRSAEDCEGSEATTPTPTTPTTTPPDGGGGGGGGGGGNGGGGGGGGGGNGGGGGGGNGGGGNGGGGAAR